MLRLSVTFASAALLAACAPQTASGEASESAAAAPDREAVDMPAKPGAGEAGAPAGEESLRDMRPTDGGPDADCTSSVGAENTCIQGNYRPLPDEPEGE